MKFHQPLIILTATLALGACATNSTCADDMSYRQAASVAPIVGSNGITVPESAAALHIPPPSGKEVAAVLPTNANRRSACLDFPPEIAAPAAK